MHPNQVIQSDLNLALVQDEIKGCCIRYKESLSVHINKLAYTSCGERQQKTDMVQTFGLL